MARHAERVSGGEVEDALGGPDGLALIGEREQDPELVTAEARHATGSARVLRDRVRESDEQLVAELVPMGEWNNVRRWDSNDDAEWTRPPIRTWRW